MDLFLRIKKYLFLLAFVISITLSIHVIIVYLYDDAEMVAERGGTFSIGATGLSPSLNPTQYGQDTLNDFMLRFMYRGLLRYNPDTKTMEWDLANCDISKNLGEIRCFFKTGAVWSDGSKITLEDALATYSLLAETETNKKLQASLSKFAITREDTALVFRSTNWSIETLQLLTIPVIKKSITEQIRNEGKIQEEVYGWKYKLDKRESDPVRMSENIILVSTNDGIKTNESYSKIILRIFSEKNILVEQKDSLNLVFPWYYDDENLGQRFVKQEILTPDFVGAFINSERIIPERRKILANLIDDIVKRSENKLQSIKNPFFTESSLIHPIGENIDLELQKVGYYRKKNLPIPDVATQSGSLVKSGASIPQNLATPTLPVVTQSPEKTQDKTPLKALSYIYAPGNNSIVSLPYASEIQIEGRVPKNVTKVYVNDYQLRGYIVGSGKFIYRARVEIGNLKKGTNTYVLAFERNGKKEIIESIEIHNGDGFVVPAPSGMTESSKTLPIPTVVSTGSTLSGNTATTGASVLSREASLSGNLLPGQTAPNAPSIASTGGTSTSLSTWALLAPEKSRPGLDDNKLYYKNGTPVTLILRSLSPKTEISDISKEIVAGLEKIGFTIQLEEIESSAESLITAKNYESKNYDIFVTGINLWYIGTYIMPYFHSWQSQNGFNFSLIRNPTLDILLEELKTKDLSTEGRVRAFEKINDILKKESVLVPIGTSPLKLFIDKNIQDFHVPNFLPSPVFIDSAILGSYINKTYIVRLETKSVQGFFDWCYDHVFPTP